MIGSVAMRRWRIAFGVVVFVRVGVDKFLVRLLSVDRTKQGQDLLLMMPEIDGSNLVNNRMVKLEPDLTFDTADCTATEVTF